MLDVRGGVDPAPAGTVAWCRRGGGVDLASPARRNAFLPHGVDPRGCDGQLESGLSRLEVPSDDERDEGAAAGFVEDPKGTRTIAGGVTAAQGFSASGIAAGIKRERPPRPGLPLRRPALDVGGDPDDQPLSRPRR